MKNEFSDFFSRRNAVINQVNVVSYSLKLSVRIICKVIIFDRMGFQYALNQEYVFCYLTGFHFMLFFCEYPISKPRLDL